MQVSITLIMKYLLPDLNYWFWHLSNNISKSRTLGVHRLKLGPKATTLWAFIIELFQEFCNQIWIKHLTFLEYEFDCYH